MKKIIRILTITACVAAFAGCEKDPIDKQPLDSLAPEAFFSKARGLEAFSNNFYTTLKRFRISLYHCLDTSNNQD